MFPVLRPFLGLGGAGRYISRAASAERLLPLIERHQDLLARYDRALVALPPGPDRDRLASVMPFIRTDLSKLYETVYSYGGSAPTGVERQQGFQASAPERDPLRGLIEAERDYHGAVEAEIDAVHHHERTRGLLTSILGVPVRGTDVEGGSKARLSILRGLAARR